MYGSAHSISVNKDLLWELSVLVEVCLQCLNHKVGYDSCSLFGNDLDLVLLGLVDFPIWEIMSNHL
jgi:hypothetical protein